MVYSLPYLIYKGHKSIWTRARPLSRKQMWEPRALDLFQVIFLGCVPDLSAIVRNDFLGSQQSDHSIQSCREDLPQPAVGELGAHSSCSIPGDSLPFLGSLHKWCFLIFGFLFLLLSFFKYTVLKGCLKHLCGKTSWMSFSVNVLNNTETI